MANPRVRLLHRRRSTAALPEKRSAGQSLVEFALVFPLFFILVLGVIEFAFAFNAILAVNYASRNAALVAAEAGSATGADCAILSGVEQDIGPPASHAKVTKVEIYRANSDGTDFAPAARTTFTRTGTKSCTQPDGTNVTVPYSLTGVAGYPEASRCNVLAGCGGTHTPSVDHVGVRIYYDHAYVTPLRTFVGTGTGITFDRTNVMRMEPVQ